MKETDRKRTSNWDIDGEHTGTKSESNDELLRPRQEAEGLSLCRLHLSIESEEAEFSCFISTEGNGPIHKMVAVVRD